MGNFLGRKRAKIFFRIKTLFNSSFSTIDRVVFTKLLDLVNLFVRGEHGDDRLHQPANHEAALEFVIEVVEFGDKR